MTGLCRDSISRIVPWFTSPKYGARCLYLITNSLGCCWLDTAEIYCPFSYSNFGHDSLRVPWPLYFYCNWCEHFVPGVTCTVPLRYLFTGRAFLSNPEQVTQCRRLSDKNNHYIKNKLPPLCVNHIHIRHTRPWFIVDIRLQIISTTVWFLVSFFFPFFLVYTRPVLSLT